MHRKSPRYTISAFALNKEQYQQAILSGRQFKDQALRQTFLNKQPPHETNKKYQNVYTHQNSKIQKVICDYEIDTFCTKVIVNKKNQTKVDSNQSIGEQANNQYKQQAQIQIKKVNSKKRQIYVDQKNQNSQQLNPKKIGVLKRLLENYKTKSLKKKHYQKLINTFGLRIQSVKYQNSRKKIRITKFSNSTNKKISLADAAQFNPLQQQFINFNSHRIPTSQRNTGILDDFRQRASDIQYNSRKDQVIRPNTTSKIQRIKRQKPLKYSSADKDCFQNRLRKYKQFLFAINLSNNIYRDLDVDYYQPQLKYYVGCGNNGNLIVSVMKKRFWFIKTNNYKQANFIWTQIKLEDIFLKQTKNTIPIVSYGQINKKNTKTQNQASILPRKRGGPRIHQPKNPYLKILNSQDYKIYQSSKKQDFNKPKWQDDFLSQLNNIKKPIKFDISAQCQIVHNHLPGNGLLGNKKAMFYCLRQYYKLIKKDIFSIVPLTFHIQEGIKDQEFKKFLVYYNERKRFNKPNIWIIKPGEYTNRGNGISCTNKLQQIKKRIACNSKNLKRTYILQSYIMRPFLYNRRKFDIRAYMLITINNGILKGYWYQQGYVRTSSSFFDLQQLGDPMIHLTNDAIQKNGQQYGRFQQGNKLSYNQLQRYLQSISSKYNFYNLIYPEMRRIATDAIKSTCLFLDPSKRENNFQIFGLDFMIDQNFQVWLIQINTNPCLELSCGILQRLIPHMIQNAFRIGLDPIFPPQNNYAPSKKYNVAQNALYYNKFELVFDEGSKQANSIRKLFQNSQLLQQIGVVAQDKQQYENEGQIIQIND